MNFKIQPLLESDKVKIRPLVQSDFESLYPLDADVIKLSPLDWVTTDIRDYHE